MAKTVLITGGAQGIGRAIALSFARHGWRVSVADIHREAGAELIRIIQREGGRAMFVPADISVEREANKWIELTVREWGRIDALINDAGIGRNGSPLTLPIEEFDRVIAVNLRGTFICSRLAARHMKNQGGGAIVNIASTRALMSEPNTEAYSASKGGILALTHAMAISLGDSGIRVNAISPGWIEVSDWQYSPVAQVPVHTERDRLQHPVGRVGVPEDIASLCLFLCGEQSGFITGQNFVVDGGMTVKMIYE